MTTRSPMRSVAGADLLEAGDHPQAGRLAAARWSDEDHEFAVADLQVEVLDGLEIAVHLVDVLERHRRHGATSTPSGPSRAHASSRRSGRGRAPYEDCSGSGHRTWRRNLGARSVATRRTGRSMDWPSSVLVGRAIRRSRPRGRQDLAGLRRVAVTNATVTSIALHAGRQQGFDVHPAVGEPAAGLGQRTRGRWRSGAWVPPSRGTELRASWSAVRVAASLSVINATLPLDPQVEPLTPLMSTPLAAMASVTGRAHPALFSSSTRNAFMIPPRVAFRPVRGAEVPLVGGSGRPSILRPVSRATLPGRR